MADLIGSANFPIVSPTAFMGVAKVTVTSEKAPGQEYICIGSNAKMSICNRYGQDPSSSMSIASAFEAAVLCGAIKDGEQVYVNLYPVTLKLKGASEGLAVILAMLGFDMVKADVMATGYVDSFGIRVMDMNGLLSLKIRPVDGLNHKIQGAIDAKLSLFIVPACEFAQHAGKFADAPPKCVKLVRTLGEAMKALDSHIGRQQ